MEQKTATDIANVVADKIADEPDPIWWKSCLDAFLQLHIAIQAIISLGIIFLIWHLGGIVVRSKYSNFIPMTRKHTRLKAAKKG